MGDWIDELGNDDGQPDKSEELHTRALFHRAEVIRQKKHALWTSLMNVIHRDVEKFGTKFKGRRSIELTAVSELGFSLYKSPFPTVLMNAEIPFDGTSIKVSYITTFNQLAPMERTSESFELTVDESDNLLIAHNGRLFSNLDAVSRFLLEPVFTIE